MKLDPFPEIPTHILTKEGCEKQRKIPHLVLNRWVAPDGEVLISRSRHDFVPYTDKQGDNYFVDGGTDYTRTSGSLISECLYSDDPHEILREAVTWGTYGKDGESSLEYKPIANMATEHIKAVLETQRPTEGIKIVMENELEWRVE